ncbi:Large repetitive protein [Caballeronia sordidicola]|uniref:Large repetitive protein n=1 Tax=Caballeronia sordidicola TaxID=196367 RepID=A0A226WYW4_CABSO|nr:Large repetitive protein [Caballeronia sordidicola]
MVHGSVSSALLAGETLAVYRDGQKVGTATVSGTGWTFNDSGVGVGSHTYTAQVENSSGNGPRSGPFTFNELSNVPSAPVITDVQDAVGPVQGPVPNNGTTDDNQPTIRGTGTAGDTLWLFVDGRGVGETTVDGTGHWSIIPPTALLDGAHTFTATQFASGQPQSALSNPWTVTVDTAPHTPVETVAITNLVDDSSGSYVNVPSGGSTKDTSPIVQGTVSSALLTGETLVVYRDSVKVGTATVNGTSWSFNDSNVAVGDHTYTARVENSVGTGQYSAGYSFTEASASTHLQGIKLDISGMVNPLYGSTYPNYIMDIQGAPVDSNNTCLIALLQVGDQSLRVNTYFAGNWYTGNNMNNLVEGIYYGSMGLNTVVTITAYGTTGTGRSQLINKNDVYTYSSTIGQILAAEVQYPYPAAGYDSPNYYHTYLTATGAKSTLPTVLSATHHDSSVDAQALAAAGTTDQPAATADQPHSVVGDHQAFTGTTGHDTVDLNVDPTVYFKEATAHIQGSTVHPADATSPTPAVNTLHLTGDHQILDLTSLTGKTAAAKISGIEVIDLGGHENHLKLSLTDVLNLGEQDLFQKDGKQQMMVNGADGDSVDLSNAHIAGVADGVWHQEGTAQVGGVTYNVYEHSGAHTELLIQQGVQIALHN